MFGLFNNCSKIKEKNYELEERVKELESTKKEMIEEAIEKIKNKNLENFKQFFKINSVDDEELGNPLEYEIPDIIKKRFMEQYLKSEKDYEIIKMNLMIYFSVIKKDGYAEMIDKPADDLWHLFLLDTKSYIEFCIKYIGFFIHHHPYIEEKEVSEKDLMKLQKSYRKIIIENHDFLKKNKYKTSLIDNKDNLNLFTPALVAAMIVGFDDSYSNNSNNSYVASACSGSNCSSGDSSSSCSGGCSGGCGGGCSGGCGGGCGGG